MRKGSNRGTWLLPKARFRWTPAPSMVGLLFQTLLILRTDFMSSSNPELTFQNARHSQPRPQKSLAGSGGLDADQELMSRMETALRLALSGMLVLEDRDAGASGFANIQGRPIPAINLYG